MAIRNVVLCKDCKYYIELPSVEKNMACINLWCGMEYPTDEDFCSLGVRKDSENENLSNT